MRTSRFPLLAGTVLALSATLYFTQSGQISRTLIALHGLVTLIVLVGIAIEFPKSTVGGASKSWRLGTLAIAASTVSLWILIQVARFFTIDLAFDPLFVVIGLLAFLAAALFQDQELPAQTRGARFIDGLLLTFVVLGLEWFTVIENRGFSFGDLLANIALTMPFISLFLFLVFSHRTELFWAVGGTGLVSAFMLDWVNNNGDIPAYWDLISMAGLVAFSMALFARRTERAPSLIGPLLPYLLGVIVITLGVFHAIFGDMTAVDVGVIAAVGLMLISRQTFALVEQRSLLAKLVHQESQLRHIAMHDVLTSLPNRTLFQDRLEHAVAMRKRDGGELTLLYIDVDGFKNINDEYGHVFGDELLIHVAQRLATWVRPSDTVARLGGDEFVVLMESGKEGSLRVAERLFSELARPYEISRRTFNANASIGIYTCTNWDGDVTQVAERIVNSADKAMYIAKGEARGIHVID